MSINLGNTFRRISRIGNIPLTWILVRVFAYLSSFISQILYFIYWTVLIFTLICFKRRDTENQQYLYALWKEVHLIELARGREDFYKKCSSEIFFRKLTGAWPFVLSCNWPLKKTMYQKSMTAFVFFFYIDISLGKNPNSSSLALSDTLMGYLKCDQNWYVLPLGEATSIYVTFIWEYPNPRGRASKSNGNRWNQVVDVFW